MVKGLGQDTILKRCQDLDKDAIYGLFFMFVGGLTETDTWPTVYMLLSEMLPTFERANEVEK
jgi:hypothetical protein